MYIERNYSFWRTLRWSQKPLLIGLLYAGFVTALSWWLHWTVLVPWQAISVIGIAVAFYLGFKNNSSYDRTWEARKIWGSIVNNSRSFGAAAVAMLPTRLARELIYRHIAWLISLRYQLRLSRTWEHANERLSNEFNPEVCESYYDRMDTEIAVFISPGEFMQYKTQTNMAAQIQLVQSIRIKEILDQALITDFQHMIMQNLITSHYEDQGRCERIKNFPFPRQYASAGLWIAMVFCALLPFGLLDTYKGLATWAIWLTVPTSAAVTWVFFLMEKIGDYSENPFEGTYNDVPITSIARNIEIDLREMLGDTDIPLPIRPTNGFLM